MTQKEIIINRLQGFAKRTGDQCWVIEFEGELLKMPSGKSAWGRINHAKAALSNALPDYEPRASYHDPYIKLDRKAIVKELEDEGRLVFKNLAAAHE